MWSSRIQLHGIREREREVRAGQGRAGQGSTGKVIKLLLSSWRSIDILPSEVTICSDLVFPPGSFNARKRGTVNPNPKL